MKYFIFEKVKNGATWSAIGDERWVEDAKRNYNKGLTVAYKIYKPESSHLKREFDVLRKKVKWD